MNHSQGMIDLEDPVLLHVGGQITRSHLVILDFDRCQFLKTNASKKQDFQVEF